MRRLLGLILIPCLLPATSLAGEADTQISLDYFRGNSRRVLMDGSDENFSAHELGMRLRLDLVELDDRLSVHVDYRGREPLSGDIENSTQRLLYRGEIRYEVIEDTLTVRLGRFAARSGIFLPVDALAVDLTLGDVTLSVWGGRRGISTSRKNLALERFLPAAGLNASYFGKQFDLEAVVAFARDDLFLLTGRDATTREYDALNAYLSGRYRPIERLYLGGQLTFFDQASFVLGPTWDTIDVSVSTLGLFSALAYAEYRPLDALRIGYDVQFQSASAFRAGTVDSSGTVTADVEPTFFDNRFFAAVRPLDLGWIRAEGRYRIRPDRTELRVGGRLVVDRLGLEGLSVRGRILVEDIAFDDPADRTNLDRMLWSAALGYRGFDLDLRLGARFLDRSGTPVSGLQNVPDVIEDLAPFVLDAQRILFLRAFYSAEQWFLGLDIERNVDDDELRLFVSAGTVLGATW